MKDRALNTIHARGLATDHHLETLAEYLPPERDAHPEHQDTKAYDAWIKLPPHAILAALAHIEVYLDNLI